VAVELLILGIALLLLLLLNAFFVLAEFSIVKVRATRVAELVAAGNRRARVLVGIQERLDEYLSVCQVGITLASVALGMVGKEATDVILGHDPRSWVGTVVGIGISLLVVSGSHIVLGEQVPKLVALRVPDRFALLSAAPLKFFHVVFYPALWVLTALANGILRLLGVSHPTRETLPSEAELRIILDRSQEGGMMSFRRLLFMENVFDFGGLSVRDAMRPRSVIKCLDAGAPWEKNLEQIRASRFTRYPLTTAGVDRPVGFVHLKDVLVRGDSCAPDLAALTRPLLTAVETAPLEALLVDMQRRRNHAALVLDDKGQWTGFLTLEDVIEELVGTIRDEFEDEEPVRLADALTLERIHLDIEADSPLHALRLALSRMKPESLPMPMAEILQAVEFRERQVGTYLGDGVGMPHARVTGLTKPFVMLLRSASGVTCAGTSEKGHILFVLLTPAGQARIHQRLQSTIATLMNESEYVKDRLMTATTAAEVLDVIRTGEQAALD
jgi:CBS domain containing-hemolysin-like protein/mannitol/fructose-specific phosphotransferase system IIA component